MHLELLMKQLKNHLKKKRWRKGDVDSLVSLLQLCSSEQRTLAEVGKYVSYSCVQYPEFISELE